MLYVHTLTRLVQTKYKNTKYKYKFVYKYTKYKYINLVSVCVTLKVFTLLFLNLFFLLKVKSFAQVLMNRSLNSALNKVLNRKSEKFPLRNVSAV